ncbi:polysaccharide lyase [Loktanella salsilacus]|uniref:polysaccharide lyase n=1 Tax=Loktanella salsilacus TaxID=195913 RepID=UPI003735A446
MTQIYTTSEGSTTHGAIRRGFENHSSDLAYSRSLQKADWDFEFGSNTAKNAAISDEEAMSGSQSLKVTYRSDDNAAAASSWKIPAEGEYYLSYWVKFADDFDFDGDDHSGGKLPGLASDGLASGGDDVDGSNGFTARYMWREDGEAELYLYHMDKPGAYGESFKFFDEQGDPIKFEQGAWHNLVQRVQINSGNMANGEVEVWFDGEQVLDLDGLQFVDDGSQIDRFYFSSFFGGNTDGWLPDYDVSAYFDDIVISTNAADVGLGAAQSAGQTVTDAQQQEPAEEVVVPPVEATPALDTDASFEFNFVMDKNWGSGAILELQITNTGNTDVTNWRASFDLGDLEIESIWRAEVSVAEDGRFIVDGIQSGDDIDAGETVRIGMKVSDGNLDMQALNQTADFDLLL